MYITVVSSGNNGSVLLKAPSYYTHITSNLDPLLPSLQPTLEFTVSTVMEVLREKWSHTLRHVTVPQPIYWVLGPCTINRRRSYAPPYLKAVGFLFSGSKGKRDVALPIMWVLLGWGALETLSLSPSAVSLGEWNYKAQSLFCITKHIQFICFSI